MKFFNAALDYFKGLIEILVSDTPRYCFTIQKLDITYQNGLMRSRADYTPVGCYRQFKNFISELDDETVCRKFKPIHARMIIGIDVLEKNLDFNNKDQVLLYLKYIQECKNQLEGN